MRYIHRNKDGIVQGHYANPQPGYAEEEVADDHPDIRAWTQKIDAMKEASILQKATIGNEALYAEIQALKIKLTQLEKTTATPPDSKGV